MNFSSLQSRRTFATTSPPDTRKHRLAPPIQYASRGLCSARFQRFPKELPFTSVAGPPKTRSSRWRLSRFWLRTPNSEPKSSAESGVAKQAPKHLTNATRRPLDPPKRAEQPSSGRHQSTEVNLGTTTTEVTVDAFHTRRCVQHVPRRPKSPGNPVGHRSDPPNPLVPAPKRGDNTSATRT